MTEISYRGIFLYTYYDFVILSKFGTNVNCYILVSNLMFIFSKFVSFIFLDKFSPKIWSFPNWLKFCTRVHFWMFITTLMIIFSKFCRSYNFGQTWSQNLMLLPKSTEIWFKGTLLYAHYAFDVWFFEVFAVHKFLGQKISFHLKICWSPYLLKFRMKQWGTK